MRLTCHRCKKTFDPSCESARCSPHYGHVPTKPTEQNLSRSLMTTKEPAEKRKQFQSDFMLIWDEPAKYR